MKQLSKFWKQHTSLVIGAIISIVFLIGFLLFQYNLSEILKLETRWLIVSGVPILVALIIGGYIKSFKGFGVELEASLEKPISNLTLTATEAMAKFQGDEKGSISYLQNLPRNEKSKISRLVFIQGKTNYYSHHAIEQYFYELDRLKYIEIRSENGKFLALIPMSEFIHARHRHRENINHQSLEKLIMALEKNEILSSYQHIALTVNIQENIGVIESLRIMKNKRLKQLIVLDDNDNFVGLLSLHSVEKKIIENVLQAKEIT